MPGKEKKKERGRGRKEEKADKKMDENEAQ